MKKYLFGIFLAMAAIQSHAYTYEDIYDTDGNADRLTEYAYGPIKSMETVSRSAYNLRIVIDERFGSCYAANIYDALTGSYIKKQAKKEKFGFSLIVEKGHEYAVKNFEVICRDENDPDKRYFVIHKIPGAPKIVWDSQIEAKNWTDGYTGFNPGYYKDVTYSASISIDNGTKQGRCTSGSMQGNMPSVFSERHEAFYNDVVQVSGKAGYNARGMVMVNQINCVSHGGMTNYTEVWHISKGRVEKETSENDVTIF